MSQEDTPPIMEVVGPACGRHGPYTFFKYCRCRKPGLERTMKLGDFLFLNIMDTLSLILAELQLVWRNRSDPDQLLCSLRVYYRPENTPGGRLPYHDKNELLCCTEKIVVKAEDLVTWLSPSQDWNVGLCPPPVAAIPLITTAELTTMVTELLPKFDWCPILLENILVSVRRIVCPPPDLSNDLDLGNGAEVHVVSFNRYCRLQALLLRMRQFASPAWLHFVVFHAVCGLEPAKSDVRVLFCRQTFECEDLKKITKRCDYLAPNLKGRPRKRCRLYETQLENRKKARRSIREQVTRANRAAAATPSPLPEKPTPEEKVEKIETPFPLMKEKDFMKELRAYMKELKMPLGKVPCLGGKSIDLFKFYKFVQDHGGYQKMCDRRLWKRCYEHLKCPRASTAAATQTRKHYEKLLLPYEAHQKERACQVSANNPTTPQSPAKRAKTKAQVKKESEVRMGQPLTGHDENSWPVVKNRRKTKQKPRTMPPDEVELDLDMESNGSNGGTSVSRVTPTRDVSNNAKAESVEEIVILSEDSEHAEKKNLQVVPPIEEEEITEIDLRCSEEMDSKFIPVQPKISISPVLCGDDSSNHRASIENVTSLDIVTQTPIGQSRQFESQSEVSGKFTVSNLSVELSGTIYDYVSNVIGQALIKDTTGYKDTTANQSRGSDTTANQSRVFYTTANQSRSLDTTANQSRGLNTTANQSRELDTIAIRSQGSSTTANQNRGLNTTANQSRGSSTTANQNRGLDTRADQKEPEIVIPSMVPANPNSAHKRSSPLKYRTILPKSESLPKPLDIVQPISPNHSAHDLAANQTQEPPANHNSETSTTNRKPALVISTEQRPTVIQPSGLVSQLPPMPPLLANYEPISPPTPESSYSVCKPTFTLEQTRAERMKSVDSLFASSPKLLTALSPALSPGLPPGLTPGLPPGLSPGLPPGLSQRRSPGLSPSLPPGLSPSLPLSMSQRRSPGLSPSMPPGLSPRRSPGSSPSRPPGLPARLSPHTCSPSTPHKSPRPTWTPSPFSWNPNSPSTSGPTFHPPVPSPAPSDDLPLDLSMKPKLRPESKTETGTKNTGALDLSLQKYELLNATPHNDNFSPKPVPKLIPLHRSVPEVDLPRNQLETISNPGTSNYWKQNHLNPYSNGIMYTAAQNGPGRPETSAWDRIYSLYSLPQQQALRPSPVTGPESAMTADAGRRANYLGYHSPAVLNNSINSATRPEMVSTRPEMVSNRPEILSTRPEMVSNRPEMVSTRPELKSIYSPYTLPSRTNENARPTATISAFGPAYVDYMSQLSYLNHSRAQTHHHRHSQVMPSPYPPVPSPVLRPQIRTTPSTEPSVLTTSAPIVNGMYGTQVPAYYNGYMSMLSSRPSPSYQH